MTGDAGDRRVPVVSIPDIRDYDRINAELVQQLDDGHAEVRLVGAEGQRFLAAGLTGPWRAVVEVEGYAGPELAAGMDAPGLTVVCRGPAADGAARALRAGRVVILGDADVALAYVQAGGIVLVSGSAGPRAGLNQAGGILVVLGSLGPLAGERQSGGWLFAREGSLGRHAGRGQRGGRLVRLPSDGDPGDPSDAELYRMTLQELAPWVPSPFGTARSRSTGS
jgi:glutamate synthase domain-containing protein 3